jgi:hypothetical protein
MADPQDPAGQDAPIPTRDGEESGHEPVEQRGDTPEQQAHAVSGASAGIAAGEADPLQEAPEGAQPPSQVSAGDPASAAPANDAGPREPSRSEALPIGDPLSPQRHETIVPGDFGMGTAGHAWSALREMPTAWLGRQDTWAEAITADRSVPSNPDRNDALKTISFMLSGVLAGDPGVFSSASRLDERRTDALDDEGDAAEEALSREPNVRRASESRSSTSETQDQLGAIPGASYYRAPTVDERDEEAPRSRRVDEHEASKATESKAAPKESASDDETDRIGAGEEEPIAKSTRGVADVTPRTAEPSPEEPPPEEHEGEEAETGESSDEEASEETPDEETPDEETKVEAEPEESEDDTAPACARGDEATMPEADEPGDDPSLADVRYTSQASVLEANDIHYAEPGPGPPPELSAGLLAMLNAEAPLDLDLLVERLGVSAPCGSATEEGDSFEPPPWATVSETGATADHFEGAVGSPSHDATEDLEG